MLRLLVYFAFALIGVTEYKFANYPLTTWLLVLCSVIFVVHHLLSPELPVRKDCNMPLIFVAGMLFMVAAVVSSFNSSDFYISLVNSFRILLVYVVLPYVLYNLLQDRESIDSLFVCLAVAGISLGVGASLQYLGVHGLPPEQESRITGWTNHPNELGMMSALMLVPSLYVSLVSSAAVTRVLGHAGVVMCILGVAMSASFTAIIVMFVALACFLSVFMRKGVATLLVNFLVAVVLFMVMKSSVQDVSSAGFYHSLIDRVHVVDAKSVGSRVDTYSVAAESILQEPILGEGLAFADRYAGEFQVHNSLLLSWYTTGSLGVLLFMMFVVLWIRRLYLVYMTSFSLNDEMLVLSVASSFFGMLATMMVSPVIYEIVVLFPVFLLYAVSGSLDSPRLHIGVKGEM